MSRGLKLLPLAAGALAMLLTAGTAGATHSWGGYHWARSANPFTVTFSNNLTSNWTPYLTTAASDWSVTSGPCNNAQNPVRTTVVSGNSNPRRCRPTSGQVEVCNASYGNNGWLGIAQVWVNGTHIVQGTVKVNDYYYNQPQYDTPAWRSLVMDQETGHTLGLDHQDSDSYNADLLDACGRGSCMDYSSDPSNNRTPNQHDYDQLVTIYNHPDGLAQPALAGPADNGVDLENPSSWGQAVRFANGRGVLYERVNGPGEKLYTWVIWAQ